MNAMTTKTNRRAPGHLSPKRRRLYRRVADDFELWREPHALEVLRLACEALDRGDDARAAIAKHGTTYDDRFGQPRARPEIAIERDSRLAVARLFRELSLDGGAPDDARPPRIGTGALA